MSANVFPCDPALPELAAATDASQMTEAFRAYLRPVSREAYEIRGCKLARLRYRRGNRCVLQYELRLADRATGQERKQWISGLLHADGRTTRRWKKLQTINRNHQFPATFAAFEPVSFIPNLRMLVQVFPQDRRLPSLPKLAAGPPIEIQSMLLARFGSGDWRIERCDVHPVAYRAGLGAVLKYVLHARKTVTGETAQRCFYAKVYPDDRGERTHQLLQSRHANIASEGEMSTVVETVAYLANLRALVLAEAPGVCLSEILVRGRDSLATVRRVARALARFHLSDVAIARQYSREDEVASLRKATTRIQSSCPELIPEVTRTVQAIADRFETAAPHPTHRDLKPDHILLNGNSVVFIDLDSCAAADPVLDPADLVSRLKTMHLPGDCARAAAHAFSEEYFAHVPPSWRDRFVVHYAGAHIHLAAGFFRDQCPGWHERMTRSIREAARSMNNEIW